MRHTKQIVATSFLVTASALAASNAEPDRQPEGERMRILQGELQRERQALAQAEQQRDERTRRHDAAGTQEATLAVRRATENVAALQREIAATSTDRGGGAAARPVTRRAESATPLAWWDVYRRPPTQSR